MPAGAPSPPASRGAVTGVIARVAWSCSQRASAQAGDLPTHPGALPPGGSWFANLSPTARPCVRPKRSCNVRSRRSVRRPRLSAFILCIGDIASEAFRRGVVRCQGPLHGTSPRRERPSSRAPEAIPVADPTRRGNPLVGRRRSLGSLGRRRGRRRRWYRLRRG